MECKIDFKNFVNSQSLPHGIFGKIRHVELKTHPNKFLVVKTILDANEQIQQEIKLWEKLQVLPNKPKAIPSYMGCYSDPSFYGKNYNLVFEFSPVSLSEIIKKNSKSSFTLPFQKIFRYFKSIVNALAFLQTMGICHQNLTPESLYLNSTHEQIYITDICESKHPLIQASEQIKNDLIYSETHQFFSPELESAVFTKSNSNQRINPYKADVFSLGLIVLQLGNSELPLREKDDNKKWKDNIDKDLKDFKSRYASTLKKTEDKKNLDQFIDILKQCLKIKSEDRPDFITLFMNFLKMNEETLRNLILLDENKNYSEVVEPKTPELNHCLPNKILVQPSIDFSQNEKKIKDFILYGKNNLNSMITISGMALNANEKISYSDNSDLKKTLQEWKPLVDLNIEISSPNDPKNYDCAEFLLNENMFPETLFNFDQFPFKKFAFLCIPGIKLINTSYQKFLAKIFFNSESISNLIQMPKQEKGGCLQFKHFHEGSWYKGLSDRQILPILNYVSCNLIKKMQIQQLEFTILTEFGSISDDTLKAILSILGNMTPIPLNFIQIVIKIQSSPSTISLITAILQELKKKILGTSKKNLHTLSFLFQTQHPISKEAFQTISEILKNVKSLQILKMMFNPIFRDTDFKKNDFINSLQKVIPKLSALHLGLSSVSIEPKENFNFENIESLFLMCTNQIGNQMKSLSLYFFSPELILEKVSPYLYAIVSSKKNLINFDIIWFGKEKENFEQVKDKIESYMRQNSQNNENGILLFSKCMLN